MKLLRTALASATLALAGTAGAAGAVDVTFLNADNYFDAGTSKADERANLDVLARHLRQLGHRVLPSGHLLKVEVLDVDLAGTVRPTRRGSDLRTMRGTGDYPIIHLRYTLQAPGQQLRTGEEQIRDINYTRNAVNVRSASDPLYYEKRMLEKWFEQRFAS